MTSSAIRLLRLVLCVSLLVSQAAFANETANEEAKVQAYIAKQKAAGVAPRSSNPNWKPGYTCNDLKKHSFAEYQECRYYYAVHGRFYPN